MQVPLFGRRFSRVVIGYLCLSCAFLSLNTGAAPGDNVDDVAEQIAVETSKTSDAQIRARIEGILTKLGKLQDVTVSVDGGVVLLGGSTPNSNGAEQAVTVASRVAGVVTVQDQIDRTLGIQDNISPVEQSLRDMTQNMLRALPLFGLALIVMVLIISIGWFISRRKLITRLAPNPFVAELISQVILVFSIIVALVVALSLIGAGALLGTLLGGAGVMGIAVGFAVRDTIENYIASIMLSLRQPFRAGDHVVIDEREGVVIRLTTRATILMTMDGNHLRIPNAQVFKGVILNYTTNPERRFEFKLGVDADDNAIEAINMGLAKLEALDFVLDTPKPNAWIVEVGNSNIVINFLGWVDQNHTDFSKARSLAISEVKCVLEQGGFSLPEPIYRVRLDATNTLNSMFENNQNTPKSTPNTRTNTQENIAVDVIDTSAGEVTQSRKQSTVKASSQDTDQMDVSADNALKAKVEKEQLSEDNLLSKEAKVE